VGGHGELVLSPGELVAWLTKAGISHRGGAAALDNAARSFVSDRQGTPAALPELFVAFAVFVEAVEEKPSVATAVSMLRLHASPGDARSCLETVLRYVDNVLRTPKDPRLWRVSSLYPQLIDCVVVVGALMLLSNC